ncbi:hypothetical protein ABPG73_022890 [Tetrahymena malaccensis]
MKAIILCPPISDQVDAIQEKILDKNNYARVKVKRIKRSIKISKKLEIFIVNDKNLYKSRKEKLNLIRAHLKNSEVQGQARKICARRDLAVIKMMQMKEVTILTNQIKKKKKIKSEK